MALVAVYDACVLHPAALRDTLIRLALAGLVRARWSDAILDEWERSILLIRPDLDRAALRRTRELMNLAVPDAVISGFEVLVAGLDLRTLTIGTSLPQPSMAERRPSSRST